MEIRTQYENILQMTYEYGNVLSRLGGAKLDEEGMWRTGTVNRSKDEKRRIKNVYAWPGM